MRCVRPVRLLPLSLVWLGFALAAPAAAAVETRPLAAGGEHTCALKYSGAVMCWGDNDFGQLGNGSLASSVVPVAVPALASGVQAIDAGYSHTCAIASGGALRCWGYNANGQLGIGGTANSSVPVTVLGLASGVAAVATGSLYTCALTTGGAVLCWGDNEFGQLGNGSSGSGSTTPIAVSGLSSGVAAIAAGYKHTCALTTGGAVLCWGWSDFGQLGNGSTAASYVPVAVTGLSSGVTAIAAGAEHTCAIAAGAGAVCWGKNENGQLGNGATVDSSVPVAVSGLASGVATIAAGDGHTCAIATGGAALCWGSNERGALGNGASANSSVPVAVSGLASGVTALATGSGHTCVLTADGAARCWGYNHDGQLGIGTAGSRRSPIAVAGFASGAAALGAASAHTCALTTGGGVQCWGYGGNGELGNGSAGTSYVPVAVTGLESGAAAISVGFWHNCAITTGGGALCWGSNNSGQLGVSAAPPWRSLVPVAVTGLSSGVAAIAVGGLHTCALTTTGGMSCWGNNGSGQLGDGTTTSRNLPAAVSGLASGVEAIATGGAYSCALKTDGAVLCWGSNYFGQLGDGTTTDRKLPVAVTGLPSSVAAIASGGDVTCAVTTGGATLCWGYNGYGGLGSPTDDYYSSVPVTVTGLGSGVAAVAPSASHTCALETDGGVLCWGSNYSGQLGDGTTESSNVPLAVSGLASGVAAIATGYDHSCVLTASGGIQCWGSDSNGELGDGHVPTSNVPLNVIGFNASAPVQVPALDPPGLALLIAALAVTASTALARAGAALSPRR